mmetsp:Transcript_5466/g.5630  ORF Transcript_5466/g.5630 Transcript_5466/m.5630 type:complete len:168 (+) Transcript_5466:210-713(+)
MSIAMEVRLLDQKTLGELCFSQQNCFWDQLTELGIASGISQDLQGPITTKEKLIDSNHNLIIASTGDYIVGFLKYGIKKLYFYRNGSPVEYNPQCLLDFYVRESHQRQGVGQLLFNRLLQVLSLSPVSLAYDRPSLKLLEFMKKHYNLDSPEIQPNRYTIYQGFLSS